MRKIHKMINLRRYNQNTDGAALNHAAAKTAMPARETTVLRTMPKTKKTPSSKTLNKTIGRMGKLALMNRPQTKIRRTVITFHPPRMR